MFQKQQRHPSFRHDFYLLSVVQEYATSSSHTASRA